MILELAIAATFTWPANPVGPRQNPIAAYLLTFHPVAQAPGDSLIPPYEFATTGGADSYTLLTGQLPPGAYDVTLRAVGSKGLESQPSPPLRWTLGEPWQPPEPPTVPEAPQWVRLTLRASDDLREFTPVLRIEIPAQDARKFYRLQIDPIPPNPTR